MNELVLVNSKFFNGVRFDCYQDAQQNDSSDFWATREQIGALLEYADPSNAITIIHKRNQERLDKFSRGDKLSRVEGNRTVTREVTVYNFKGLLEICRYSNQPKANDVMDLLWEIADEIRRTGSYRPKFSKEEYDMKIKELDDRRRDLDLRGAQILQHMLDAPAFKMNEETKAVFSHEIFKLVTGSEFLGMLPESTEKWYSAGDIAQEIGSTGNMVGRIAQKFGIKAPQGESNEFGRWIFTKSRHSNHECPSFIYNQRAMDWFKAQNLSLQLEKR